MANAIKKLFAPKQTHTEKLEKWIAERDSKLTYTEKLAKWIAERDR